MLRTSIDSLAPCQRLSRRGFVGAALGSGFAAAAQPLVAQAVKTDSVGLTVGEVTIPVEGFRLPAYRAMPQAGVGLPVVLVVSEIFGVHDYIADVARRFAKLGYLAIAPELFVRQGDPQSYGEMARLVSEVVAKVPDAQAMGDLDACITWAGANSGDVGRLGITGFCWGGRISWLYAAHSPAVKAAVAWYGGLAGEPNPLQPTQPLGLTRQLRAPVLGLYGGADAGIPLDTVASMQSALKTGSGAAQRSELVVYPDTPHAFHADYRPTYRAAAAADAWQRCIAWFQANGVG